MQRARGGQGLTRGGLVSYVGNRKRRADLGGKEYGFERGSLGAKKQGWRAQQGGGKGGRRTSRTGKRRNSWKKDKAPRPFKSD